MVVLTVQQLLTYLRELFETNAMLGDLWVAGEVSNLTRSSAGHLYFTLKDAAGQIRCVFFRRQNAGMTLEHGAQVLAHGRVSIYEQRGELNFVVDFVHAQGAGILQAQFERLRQKLEAEGLFDPERKRPLPAFPRRIGVVTSPTGAVFHDICTVVGRRWPSATIVLAPSAVQGDGAPAELVAAIADLNERGNVDVIVVARGGGSIEDLWAFNDEGVQRAIFASRAPVVSAVGHETDFTLADYTADLRAPTSSAAAELIVPDRMQVAMRLGAMRATLVSCLRHELEVRCDRIERLVEELEDARPDVEGRVRALSKLLGRAQGSLERALTARRTALDQRCVQLASLSPTGVLSRGYAVVHRDDGRLLAAASAVRSGETVSVRMHDGAFAATVNPM